MSEASRVASVAVTLPPTKIHSGFSMLNGRNDALCSRYSRCCWKNDKQARDQVEVEMVRVACPSSRFRIW